MKETAIVAILRHMSERNLRKKSCRRQLVDVDYGRLEYRKKKRTLLSREERKIAGVAGQTVALTLLGSSARPTQ